MATPTPAIVIKVGGFITFKERANLIARLETTNPHNLAVGDTVLVAAEDGTFNGSRVVTAIPSARTFEFAIGAGTLARSAGAGTGTVTPTAVALTSSRPVLPVDALETTNGGGTVNAGGRVWRNTAVDSGIRDTPAVLRLRRAGTIAINCNVTNTDPATAASANTSVTVTDPVAVAAAADQVGGVIPPSKLPFVYLDPTLATPGLPDAAAVDAAATLGSVLPTASQKVALS